MCVVGNKCVYNACPILFRHVDCVRHKDHRFGMVNKRVYNACPFTQMRYQNDSGLLQKWEHAQQGTLRGLRQVAAKAVGAEVPAKAKAHRPDTRPTGG
jgi:hypothetical protein